MISSYSISLGALSDRVYDNCLFLGDSRLQVSWTVQSDDNLVEFELCGCDFEDPNGE